MPLIFRVQQSGSETGKLQLRLVLSIPSLVGTLALAKCCVMPVVVPLVCQYMAVHVSTDKSQFVVCFCILYICENPRHLMLAFDCWLVYANCLVPNWNLGRMAAPKPCFARRKQRFLFCIFDHTHLSSFLGMCRSNGFRCRAISRVAHSCPHAGGLYMPRSSCIHSQHCHLFHNVVIDRH